jgi:hypothetical protein
MYSLFYGLSNQKINDVDFINYVKKFDVVGFVETLVSDSPGNFPEYSLPFSETL